MAEMLNKSQLIQDLRCLGVKPGDLLYLKVSMRSLGKVDGGARTVIDAVLDVIGKEGTLVVSSFVKVLPLSYLKRHKKLIYDINTSSYAGAVANEMMRHPKVELSRHPVQKFSAIGKMAKDLMSSHQETSYAYDPLRVMCEKGGKALILGKDVVGVGTTHVAIGLLAYRQKRPKLGVRYKNDRGEVKLFQLNWAGMCHDGFQKFSTLYDQVPGAIISRAQVGQTESTLTDMKKTLEIELQALINNPGFFMCQNKDCFCCQLSWEFSPAKPVSFLLRSVLSLNFKNMKLFFRNYMNGVFFPSEHDKKLVFMG